MGLSDPSAIEQWLRARGHEDRKARHEWMFLQDPPDPDERHGGDRSIRAVCGACGLIRRKPISQNAEMFIDLGGPCPGDSAYWRELQEKRVAGRPATKQGRGR